jgi:sodium transport system ATP-binding protein
MEHSPIIIDIKNVTKRFGKSATGKTALNNVSLEIPLGQIVCLLGPNGSGKTTLLKTVAGLLEPTEGSISIMGIDLAHNPSMARSHIGWMPAEDRSGFYGRLTGRQNIEFFASLHNLLKPEIDRLLGNLSLQLDMHDELDQTMLKVSGGARQKIALTRALLHNPSVLLLDEPMRNLDPHTILRFRRLLKDHLARVHKRTVLLSTHQLEEARRIADVIVILNNGEIIKNIEARDLQKELQHMSVEEFYLKTVDAEEKK